jgi:hypothetical protein
VVPAAGFSLALTDPDSTLVPFLLEAASSGRAEVQAFFERGLATSYLIRVFPDRASLTAHWRDVWRAPGLGEECWAIAAARRDEVALLSPRSWRDDACGHDPADRRHLRLVLVHELVHVLHHQLNPRLGQVANAMPWFVEGLAVHASGQLAVEYGARVREALASGYAPTRLGQLWEHPLRYGLSGSVVAHLDSIAGRPSLASLLAATTDAQVLAATGLTERDFLAGWRAVALAGR